MALLLAPLVFFCGHFCYQRLQLVLNQPRDAGDLLALVLVKQRDEAIIGHDVFSLLILVHHEPQRSI